MSIAREGYPFIIASALLFLVASGLGWGWVGGAFALLALAFLGFFRDPERLPPKGEELILSPADGRVVAIEEAAGGQFLDEAGTRISIFLSPLDVHINRAPVQGRVQDVQYRKGRFFAAYKDEASRDNEQNAMRIVDARGRSLGVVQIAGVMARRIVCYVKKGDFLERGQRVGLIMFGSRVDLFLPSGSRVEVALGQRIKGGETIVGRFA